MEKASKKNNYHYNKRLQAFANTNRSNMTYSAAAMWKHILSRRQMKGYKFKRERPILKLYSRFCLS